MKAAGSAFATLLALAAAASPVSAQTVDGALDGMRRPPAPGEAAPSAEVDQQTAEIGATLRCPVCRQQSVAESSSRIAREMQAVIRQMLMEGSSPADVEAYFVEAYGPWILLQPRAEGLNWIIYLGPGLAFAGGGLLLARRLRRRGDDGDPESEEFESALRKSDRKWIDSAIRSSR